MPGHTAVFETPTRTLPRGAIIVLRNEGGPGPDVPGGTKRRPTGSRSPATGVLPGGFHSWTCLRSLLGRIRQTGITRPNRSLPRARREPRHPTPHNAQTRRIPSNGETYDLSVGAGDCEAHRLAPWGNNSDVCLWSHMVRAQVQSKTRPAGLRMVDS